MPYDDESQRIYSYLLNLLNSTDYSEAELRKKALAKDFKLELINLQINELQGKKWQNDLRLAENIIEFYKTSRGPNWIKQKLKMRLIPESIVTTIMQSDETEEGDYDEIKSVVERKYRITDWTEVDIKIQNKVIWFLQYRGYNNVFSILQKWKNSL
jgi:SOS response regulatory protein OraA/RecX